MNTSSSSSSGGGTSEGTTPDYSDSSNSGKLAICLWHLGKEKVYEVTKIVAESDSIGESYRYCESYSKIDFQRECEQCEDGKDSYLVDAALDICLIFIYDKVNCELDTNIKTKSLPDLREV